MTGAAPPPPPAARGPERRVLWIGVSDSEHDLLRSSAASPAAVRWTQGFLRGLAANGVPYRHVGNFAQRVWPYGPIWAPGTSPSDSRAGVAVPYLNLPGVRFRHIARGLRAAVRRCVAEDRPAMVITYNAESHVAAAAREAVAAGVPWFPIVMDFDDTLLDRSWDPVVGMVRGATGVGFLSQWACESCPLPRVFHIDGGIADRAVPDRFAGDERVVLYTGTRAPWGGLDLLLKAWRGVRHPGARLWICGPRGHATIGSAAATDPRVVDFGMVSESHLQSLVEQAAVLVNPRPPFHEGNRFNFPSKVLEYLGTGKPVVSTRTLSFSPDYDEVLFFAENETGAALGRAIDRALALTPAEREAHRTVVRRFAARHGDWPAVTAAFLRWAEECGANVGGARIA